MQLLENVSHARRRKGGAHWCRTEQV